MTHAMRDQVLLGAVDWTRPEWTGGFYPGDMPEDWRLTYYNTQFDCVFLDRVRWTAAGPAQWRLWQEDTHEHFMFLLEGDAREPPPAELADKALVLARDAPQLLWFDRGTDLKSLARDLMPPGTGRRFLVSRDGDLAQLERARTLLELLGI